MAELLGSSEELAPKSEEVEPTGELAPQPEPEEESVAEPEPTGEPVPESEEKKEIKLSEPSKELAARLLGTVSFKERIIGVLSHPGPGDMDRSIYSFEEAARFLDAGDLSGEDYVSSIPFDALKKWVGETLGDTELAQAIGEITKEGDQPMVPYQQYLKSIELIIPVKDLMEQRLKQCREVLEGGTEA